MLRYMLDTNLCIRVLRDRPAGLRPRFNAEADSLCISTIVLTELLNGAEKSARADHNRREVERFAARLEILPFDANAAAHSPAVRRGSSFSRAARIAGMRVAYSHAHITKLHSTRAISGASIGLRMGLSIHYHGTAAAGRPP